MKQQIPGCLTLMPTKNNECEILVYSQWQVNVWLVLAAIKLVLNKSYHLQKTLNYNRTVFRLVRFLVHI